MSTGTLTTARAITRRRSVRDDRDMLRGVWFVVSLAWGLVRIQLGLKSRPATVPCRGRR